MRKLLLIGLLPLCTSCGPTTPTGPGQPANPIRASALVETYRDFPDRAKSLYTNQSIIVRVTRGHYILGPANELHWYATGNRSRPPALIILCRNAPTKLVPDADSDLLVAGKCLGRAWDSVDRGNDVKFIVRMTDCTLTAVSPPGGP